MYNARYTLNVCYIKGIWLNCVYWRLGVFWAEVVTNRAGLGLCCNKWWILPGLRVDCTCWGGKLGNWWRKCGRCRLHWVGLMGVVGWNEWVWLVSLGVWVGGEGVTNGWCKGVMGGERVWSPLCMERYMDGCGSLGVIGEVNWVWMGWNRWVNWIWLLTPLGGS